MQEQQDLFNIKKNFTALAIFVVIILLVIDITLRVKPSVLRPDVKDGKGQISAVGHLVQFPNGSSYFIYTIFESNGDVFQCWYDEKQWNQKKVTNYKGPTLDINN